MKVLPDVMLEKSQQYQHLDWVGMTQIQSAVLIGQAGVQLAVPMSLDIGVSLAENNRGIHMSRLYQLQQSQILNQNFSSQMMQKFTRDCLDSQAGISDFSSAKLSLQWPRQTLSLKSNLPGFRQYPVQFIFEQDKNKFQTWLQFEILYSSTCPQSAGVSMEVIHHETNGKMFERFPATPHAQRSRAQIRLQLQNFSQNAVEQFIVSAENILGTPVQTTVKKIDEMEFARLNAQNLMFCEDAVRKLANLLNQQKEVLGFHVLCEHQESLHPHNATSISAQKYSNPRVISFTCYD
ncbi:MAG: GTP cyclohydrolase I FolE2 [Bdellovibrio sp.]|nr:GTP cyclohydrolase I FolE2 [Bdellovibrio sp.]